MEQFWLKDRSRHGMTSALRKIAQERLLHGRARKVLFRCMSDKAIVYLTHYLVHGHLPDFRHQPSFSERIAFRRLFPQPVFTILSDKVRVREYVRRRIGEAYLIPIYAVTSDIENFAFENLPPAFVMKASHGSRWVEIVWSKAEVDVEQLRLKAAYWLKQNFYSQQRECHYQNIPPHIIFETLLADGGKPPKDYKIHCFRSNQVLTQIIQVHSDRFTNHKMNFLTADWTPINLSLGRPSVPNQELLPPQNLKDMLAVADNLSEGFNYVRVDLYSFAGQLYFGEMTFTPGAGLMPFDPVEKEYEWALLFEPDQSVF